VHSSTLVLSAERVSFTAVAPQGSRRRYARCFGAFDLRGLDYPGVGPELAYLQSLGRLEAQNVTDEQALKAFETLSKLEGIIPARESSHAVAYVLENAQRFKRNDIVVINISGRGDKDVQTVRDIFQARGKMNQ
jgi:tryptophan synthase beta subunit